MCKVTNLPPALTKKELFAAQHTHSTSLGMTVHLSQTHKEESVR